MRENLSLWTALGGAEVLAPLIDAYLDLALQRETYTLGAITSDGTLSNSYKEQLVRGADCNRVWRDWVSRATDRP
jgi:hypothetical protein